MWNRIKTRWKAFWMSDYDKILARVRETKITLPVPTLRVRSREELEEELAGNNCSWSYVPGNLLTVPGTTVEDENSALRKLLEKMHEGYRECMKDDVFQKQYMAAFHVPMKETAKLLQIPLWDKMTLPQYVRAYPWSRI